LRARQTGMPGSMEPQPKISIVGAGNVGAASAATIAARCLGDVYLYDIVEDLAAGKAMDINQASPFFRSDSRVVGCDCLDELAGSDIVVVAAGVPRHAKMLRKDLLGQNAEVLLSTGREIMRLCPDALVLIVSNPADMLTWLVQEQWPELRVFGLGCTLDTLRLRFFLAEAADVSVESVSALVIGTHDNNMIPLTRHATVGGARAEQVLTPEQLADVVRRTREAGATIVSRLKTRGSFYAASHCIAEVVEAIVQDARAVFPLSAPCRGEYGYDDVCLALPRIVGLSGPDGIIQVELNDGEHKALDVCAAEMRNTLQGYRGI